MKKWKGMISGVLAISMFMSMITSAEVKASSNESKTFEIADDTELKIASYNIAAKGGSTKAIGKLLKDENIDIVGFQEVDKNTSRNQKDMLKEIAEEAGFDYYFRKSIDYSGGEYGIGIVANAELANKNGANLDTGSYEGRGWQRAEVSVGDKTVAVYNTHLTWEDTEIREKQMKDVLEVMEADTTEYKVLTGDFNAQESNDEFDVYLRNYIIANGKEGKWLDTYIPFDASMKTNAIDNVITTRNINIKEVEAYEADNVGSDHKILIATCELLEEDVVSTQLLDKQIKKANELLKQTDRYTEESLAALKDAMDTAIDANKDTQEAVNETVDELNAAIEDLRKLPVDPSKAVAWWDFDGDDPMNDKTGRGNNGVGIGNVTFVPGLDNLGNALSTKDGYVSIAKVTEDLNLGKEDFSVGFWYKASNPGSWAAVLGDKDWNSGANPGMAVVQGQGQFYTTYAANGHGQQENIVGGTASKVYDNKWHYIVAVLDRDAESMLYVDGKMIASTSIASTDDMDATVKNPFNIGADGKGQYRIDSLIDDVKVYRSVLSEEEIETEYLLNCDKSGIANEEMVKKTEDYLNNLVIDPNEVDKLPTFKSEDGKIISKIFCSENDLVIDDEGNVLRQPLVDKKVQITYIVQENKENVAYDEGTMVKNKWVTVKGEKTTGKNKQPEVVPTMQEWCGADKGEFSFKKKSRIIVAQDEMDILKKAAEITKSDIKELFDVDVQIVSDKPKAGDIVLTFKDGDKKLGEQGYSLEIDKYITIRGTEYRGVFFGTRSLLQGMLTSGNNTIAYGTAVDYPNYPVRKFMLDIGRKYFPMWYLEDVVKYASWLKLTDFQSHISEDTFNGYSAFRLESDIPNLTSKDGYYTKDEYRDFQEHAADYGIRVITEIDGPAHARRFIELGNYEDAPEKYKNLGLDETHFNLSEEGGARERVLGLMDEVLEEYLGGDNPVITTDAFNIGMDEYFGNQDDLRDYAVHMYDKVVNEYGKTAFAWDSNASLSNEKYPKEMYPMDDIIIDYWKWEEVSGGMKKLMDQGYKVVNGDHRWYIVPGAQIGFYDYANEERLYNELSAGNMVGWYGNGTIFPEGHPNIVGGNMLLWNDRGMFAGYTVNDIFARQRSQYPYLAQSYWYGREDETFEEFKEKVDTIEVGPGLNNLYKDIDSDSEVVYDFDMEELDGKSLKDKSDNNYDATVTGAKLTDGPNGKQLTFDGNGYIESQHKALKWPYTAVFDLTIDENQTGDIALFEEVMPEQECVEKDGKPTGQEKRVIVMKEQEDGTYRLTYSRENFNFEHSYEFKKGQPYRIAFSSDESKATGGEYNKWNQPNTLHVNGKLVSTLQGPKKPEDFNGQWWVDSPSMNMPLEKIGQNLVGSLDNFKLYNHLLTNEEIAELGGFEDTDEEPGSANLALNKPTNASSIKNSEQDAKYATDGSMDTRWGSNYNSNVNDPFDKVEWLQIDLKDSYALGTVKLHWQAAYAEEYTVQVSEDGENFTDIITVTGGDGKEDVLDLGGAKGRYLRIYCIKAVPSEDSWKWNYGYSLFEVEAYEYEATEYTVTVNVDGSETKIKVSEIEGKLGDKMPEAPVKEGYVFKEWNTREDGTGDKVTADTPITEDITIYAIFEKVPSNIFKRHLEIAVEEAKKITEEELSNIVPAVVNEFKAALAEAEELLANEDVTQEQVNTSFDRLSKVMQMLSFEKGDKEALVSLINKISELNEEEYISSTWKKLQKQLEIANKVVGNENALEAEVMKTYEDLMRAFLELRLKPNKDKLQDLINKAENIDASKYTEKSVKALENTLENARSVFANEEATEKEVAKSENELNIALANLVEKDNNTSNPGKGDKLPNTGGTSAASVSLFGAIISTIGAVIFKKRK
ncbi:LPXTG cell wall anchor domain-containing protein [Clostridium perfringens]|nr:LPXTG cell wall anchor domain-containing protein [Clostridium perfringens]